MLRMLFGEQPRIQDQEYRETAEAIELFIKLAGAQAEQAETDKARYRRYAIGAEGLLRSLDEFEQSKYAAGKFGALVPTGNVVDLTDEQILDYHRHVYFDKNAYIRAFSLLDKLGTLLNDMLGLRTERIKAHFSYYTVLRNMWQSGLYPEVTEPLNEIKGRHKMAMNRLRGRRNSEIHNLNAELQDDLQYSISHNGERGKLESLTANLADLDECWSMVRGTLYVSFRFSCRWMRKLS